MKLNRREVLQGMLGLAGTVAAGCGGDRSHGDGGDDGGAPGDILTPPPQPNANGRNLLVMLMDDMGPHTGAYGTPGLTTPHMDRLAAEGARYERAYVTIATCSASRSSLFTGLYNFTTGATFNVQEFIGSAEALAATSPPWLNDPASQYNRFGIRSPEPTLTELLKAAGYYTGLQHKFHRSPHTRFPFDRWDPQTAAVPRPIQVAEFLAEARARGQPWYLEHSIGLPHRPWPDSSARPTGIDPAATVPPAHLPDTPVVRTDWAEYLAALRNADTAVGQVLQALDESGQADNTVVVLIGDNGIEYHRGKASTYNLGLQVPLLWRGPGIVAGSVRRELFSGVDLMPTLLDLLGLVTIGRQHGRSHAGVLTGRTTAAPNTELVGLGLQFDGRAADRSLLDGRYQLLFMPDPTATFIVDDLKLIDPWRNPVYSHIVDNRSVEAFVQAYRLLDLADHDLVEFQRPRFELYDLAADPWQVRDLSGDPVHAATLNRLRERLGNWMDRHGDPGPRP
jgi:N-sulfoglucosamine sulfohydrolase